MSINSEFYAKPITALVIEPDEVNQDTGAMLFTHGWGGNRFQHQDKMEVSADALNIACIAVEFRQSGYDFDAVRGIGACHPYDASHFQVFDVINGIRSYLNIRVNINRKRLFHYGGSQGGHIALLSSIFAPDTFAFVYASCPITYIDDKICAWTGREFLDYELSVRNVLEHSNDIKCPIFLEHGTADTTVPYTHTKMLADKLKVLNKPVRLEFYEGGEHDLTPITTKLDAYKKMCFDPLRNLTLTGQDNFANMDKVAIKCANKTFVIDWSKDSDKTAMIHWC
jgi:predicted esterase